MKDRNILLLTDGMEIGGVERHVVHLANGLHKRGVNVFVAASRGPFQNLLDYSIPFLTLPLLYDKTSRKRPLGLIRSIAILKKYIRDNNISIVHSHKRYTDFIARLITSLSKNTIHISTCHSLFTDMTWMPSFGEYTIACSKKIEEILIESYRKPKNLVRTIYNGVPPIRKYSKEMLANVKKKYGFSEDVKIISCIGGLSKQKNPRILLHAFSAFVKNQIWKNIHLILIGEGAEKKALENIIEENNISDKITLFNANCDIEEIMNVSEFCIISSVKEGFPLVMLEAASIGKPYIATDVGGVSEFIENKKNGILVPPNSVDALKEAISYLINNPNIAVNYGENARIKYQNNFTLERMLNETINVYEQALGMKDK